MSCIQLATNRPLSILIYYLHFAGMKAAELLHLFFGAVRPLQDIKLNGRTILQPLTIIIILLSNKFDKDTLTFFFFFFAQMYLLL